MVEVFRSYRGRFVVVGDGKEGGVWDDCNFLFGGWSEL